MMMVEVEMKVGVVMREIWRNAGEPWVCGEKRRRESREVG